MAQEHRIVKMVRNCIAEALKLEVSKVGLSDTLETLEADSLDRISIALKLEDCFQLEIPDERWEQIHIVGDVVALIADEQAKRQVGG
jgi:acyl carrier protein